MNMLVHYDASKEELTGSQLDKAIKFNELDLIEEISPIEYRVLPIKNYNKTAYTVTFNRTILNKLVNWRCNCQFHNTTEKTCSHIMAVKLFLKPNLRRKLQND